MTWTMSPLANCISVSVCSLSPLFCLLGEITAVGFKDSSKECITSIGTEHEERLRR